MEGSTEVVWNVHRRFGWQSDVVQREEDAAALYSQLVKQKNNEIRYSLLIVQ